MKALSIAALALFALAGCTTPEAGRVVVSSPLGGVESEFEPGVDGGMVKAIAFKDCLSRYMRELGEDEHATRGWCDCHIGQHDQWRGQQWQAYCAADAVEVVGEAPVVTLADIMADHPLRDCEQGQLVGLDDDGNMTCIEPPPRRRCPECAAPAEVVKQKAKMQAIYDCIDSVVVYGSGGEASIMEGRVESAYRTPLGCVLSRLDRYIDLPAR